MAINSTSLIIQRRDGMIDCNLTAVSEVRPGDIIFWANGNQVSGRGQASRIDISALPNVTIWFTGLVKDHAERDVESMTFTDTTKVGVVRSYARV